MIWRKFKLEWSYAVGELAIVVVGVLMALAIDQWNDERLERLEEMDAVSRILIDLQTDLQDFEFRLKSVDAKEESLLRIKAFFAGSADVDAAIFLTDIIIGADFGWNQGFAQQSTYDNLLGSGKLGIIEGLGDRHKISDSYRYYQDEHIRIDERETAFPELSYQLIPRRGRDVELGVATLERKIESGLSDREMKELVVLVQASSIRDHVTAELNLARFIRNVELDLEERAESLISLLERYQTSIQ